MKRSTSLLALVGVVAAGAAMPETPAQAQGFFGSLFGQPQYRDYRDNRYRRPPAQERRGYWTPGYREPTPPPPTVTVSPPQYFTYKPDAVTSAGFAGLAEAPMQAETEVAAAESEAAPPVEGAVGETAAVGVALPPVPEPTEFDRARPHFADVRLALLPEVAEAVEAHYREKPEFVWIDGDRLTPRAIAAVKVLSRADAFGLDPEDYAVGMPSGEGDDLLRSLARFELELTARVLSYVLDATRGRIDPNRISEYHDFPRKAVDLAATMAELAESRDIAGRIEAAHPQAAAFQALKSELARLQAETAGSSVPKVSEGTFVKAGMSHADVPNVVGAITALGSPELRAAHAATLSAFEALPAGPEREVYSPALADLVRDFQKENGLSADGIIGKNTVRAMTVETPEDKMRKVRLSMERLRWLPRDLGERHVFINQPAYTATYFGPEREPLQMRVVVGQKSNQTYFFSDEIETVEYNPYWGVPYSIIVNEMIPKLYQDPSYLDRLGYEVTNVRGQRLSSASVDWHGVATKQTRVDVRQPPGNSNALGRVKIMFPNSHAIYMHDTPAKELFRRSTRAYSHGCVRLEDPRAMAAAVLGKPVDYVNRRIAQGQNDEDKVASGIKVHVAYFTAWPAPDGRVQYFDDVYDRDDHLSGAFERTDEARRLQG